jgi:hypothetical protein
LQIHLPVKFLLLLNNLLVCLEFGGDTVFIMNTPAVWDFLPIQTYILWVTFQLSCLLIELYTLFILLLFNLTFLLFNDESNLALRLWWIIFNKRLRAFWFSFWKLYIWTSRWLIRLLSYMFTGFNFVNLALILRKFLNKLWLVIYGFSHLKVGLFY